MRDGKLVVNEKFSGLRYFISSLPECFENLGEIIYQGRNQIRVISLNEGIVLNVKRFCCPKFYNRVIYSTVRRTKAERAYDNAIRLNSMGVPTPEAVGYLLCRKCALLDYSYLVTLQLPHKRRFYEFGSGGVEGKEDVLREFAHFTAVMHDKGVFHNDYSPGNILFEQDECGVHFSVVDINRMSFYQNIAMEKGCSNFARLWGQKPMFRIIADEYAIARGFGREECYRLILKYRKRFWTRFAKRHMVKFELDL